MNGAGALFQTLAGLAVVLGLIYAMAWGAKRMRLGAPAQHAVLKNVAGLSVGTREKVVVVEVGETWLVLGVTPQSIRTLHTLPKNAAGVPAK